MKNHVKIFQFITFHAKCLIDSKPLHFRFDKIDIFTRVYDGSRYLVLFGTEKCDFIYNRFRYLRSIKSGITYAIPNNYAKIKVDSHDSLPLEKTMTFDDVTILIQSVFNKDKNSYCHILRNSFV